MSAEEEEGLCLLETKRRKKREEEKRGKLLFRMERTDSSSSSSFIVFVGLLFTLAFISQTATAQRVRKDLLIFFGGEEGGAGDRFPVYVQLFTFPQLFLSSLFREYFSTSPIPLFPQGLVMKLEHERLDAKYLSLCLFYYPANVFVSWPGLKCSIFAQTSHHM